MEREVMKKSRFSEEQIAYALRLAESGTPVVDVCRQIGVSEATCGRRSTPTSA
jgi:putative transposase